MVCRKQQIGEIPATDFRLCVFFVGCPALSSFSWLLSYAYMTPLCTNIAQRAYQISINGVYVFRGICSRVKRAAVINNWF